MKKFLLVCFFSMLAIGSAWAQSSLVPSGASFDEVNNIKIGDDLKPVDNNASEINLTSEQQATQDYIDQQEQELADSEASLPYDPSAPVSSSSSSLGGLSNQNGLDAGSIKIGDDLNPVSTTTSGDGSTLVTPTTSTTSTSPSPSPTFPTSQEGTPAGVQVQNSSDTTGIQNANADSPANTANGLAGCSGTVFEQIKCKILQFLSSLRTIAIGSICLQSGSGYSCFP